MWFCTFTQLPPFGYGLFFSLSLCLFPVLFFPHTHLLLLSLRRAELYLVKIVPSFYPLYMHFQALLVPYSIHLVHSSRYFTKCSSLTQRWKIIRECSTLTHTHTHQMKLISFSFSNHWVVVKLSSTFNRNLCNYYSCMQGRRKSSHFAMWELW